MDVEQSTAKYYESTVLTPQDHGAFLRAWDATEPTADLVRLATTPATSRAHARLGSHAALTQITSLAEVTGRAQHMITSHVVCVDIIDELAK